MSDIYQITLTTQTGETFRGKMTRNQPELVNCFVPLALAGGFLLELHHAICYPSGLSQARVPCHNNRPLWIL